MSYRTMGTREQSYKPGGYIKQAQRHKYSLACGSFVFLGLCLSFCLPVASPENHISGVYFRKNPLAAAAAICLLCSSFCPCTPRLHCLLQRFLGFSSHSGPSQVPGRGGGGVGVAFAGAGVSALLLTLLSSAGSSCEMAFSIFSSRQPPVQLQ